MRAIHITLLGCMIAVCLAGCATRVASPVRYTLDMRASGNATAPQGIVVDRLRCGDALPRKAIAIRPSATRIEYFALDEWAGGIEEMVTEKLETEFGDPEGTPAIAIHGDILAFEAMESKAAGGDSPVARVKLRLTLRPATSMRGTTGLEKTYDISEPLTNLNPGEIVDGLTRAVEKAAVMICADAVSLPNTTP